MGRTSPHSLEAEEYLLSCCLLDGQDVIARCEEAHITPFSFYLDAHQIVYDCIRSLTIREKAVDIAVVAEELKTTKQLDQVGGFAFLTQISSRIPTTAQAGYFIEKVAELASLRDMIRQATGVVEESYAFTGGMSEFVSVVREKMERVFEKASGADALERRRFDPAAPIVESRVSYRLCGIIVSTAGNLTNFVARPGAGKSATMDAMMAAAMKDPGVDADCLGFTADNPDGLPLLHFDTEQSPADYQRLLHRSLRRSKRKTFPSWFESYHLTGLSAHEARQFVNAAISRAARKAGGKIFAVLIDGVGDLVMNPNDEDECFPLIVELHKTAIRVDCPIITVLHLNPGSEKSRGHLGSHLERKAEAIMQLEKDENEVSVIWASKKRGVPLSKNEGPRFAWSNEHSMHCTVGNWQETAAAAREAKKAAKAEKNPTAYAEKYSREEMVSFYPASTGSAEPIKVIMRRTSERVASAPSPRTMDRMRTAFLADGWISEINGMYRRTADGDLWASRRPKPTPPETLSI